MEKSFLNKIKSNGQLTIFIFFFLIFSIQILIGSSEEKLKNENNKENIERIKNELNEYNETSFKGTNIIKKKRNNEYKNILYVIIWMIVIFICFISFFICISKSYHNHGIIIEEDVEYFITTVHSSNFETNDESFFKDIFL